jgi:hypothetical protein
MPWNDPAGRFSPLKAAALLLTLYPARWLLARWAIGDLGARPITEAIHRVNTEADVVWVDGHSDYGHAFEVFWERYGKDVGDDALFITATKAF